LSLFAEARELFEHALRLLPAEHAAALPLKIQLGSVCYYLGDQPATLNALQAALAAARQGDRPRELVDAFYWLSQAANQFDGNYAAAKTYLEESLTLVHQHWPDSALEARILYGLGDLNWRLSDYVAGLTLCEHSLALAQRLGEVHIELFALNRMASILMSRDGASEQARSFLQQVYEKASAIGNRERATVAQINLGFEAFHRKDFQEARACYERAVTLARKLDYPYFLSAALQDLADVSSVLGNDAEYRRCLAEALHLSRRISGIPGLLTAVQTAAMDWLRKDPLDARGWALAGLSIHHPAADENARAGLENLNLFGINPADPDNQARMTAGLALDLDQTVTALLEEFE
jgi:tetratricopeptide (TPR) repeat protein